MFGVHASSLAHRDINYLYGSVENNAYRSLFRFSQTRLIDALSGDTRQGLKYFYPIYIIKLSCSVETLAR